MKFGLGENPHKVYNIVFAQMQSFRELYKPVIDELPNVNYHPDGRLEQEMGYRIRSKLVTELPANIQSKIKSNYENYLVKNWKARDADDIKFVSDLVRCDKLELHVLKAIRDIVAYPALSQGMKGIISAGITGSMSYAGSKMVKAWQSKK